MYMCSTTLGVVQYIGYSVCILYMKEVHCGMFLYEWIDEWMDGWMGGWMDGWVDGWMDGWVNGWMDGWVDGQMDGWMDGWVDGWMGGWMDGWINTCLTPGSYVHENIPTCGTNYNWALLSGGCSIEVIVARSV